MDAPVLYLLSLSIGSGISNILFQQEKCKQMLETCIKALMLTCFYLYTYNTFR